MVTYTVNANTYSSTISQSDADSKAQNDINANGQTYANNNGYCTYPQTSLTFNNSRIPISFALTLTNTATSVRYNFTITGSNTYGTLGSIPQGVYNATINPTTYSGSYTYYIGVYSMSGVMVWNAYNLNLNTSSTQITIW